MTVELGESGLPQELEDEALFCMGYDLVDQVCLAFNEKVKVQLSQLTFNRFKMEVKREEESWNVWNGAVLLGVVKKVVADYDATLYENYVDKDTGDYHLILVG